MNPVTKPSARYFVSAEVLAERGRQDDKWGEQSHPDNTSVEDYGPIADKMRDDCEWAFAHGAGSWTAILLEEVGEALAEEDPEKLRTELLQVAAVCVAWVEDIDRRTK